LLESSLRMVGHCPTTTSKRNQRFIWCCACVVASSDHRASQGELGETGGGDAGRHSRSELKCEAKERRVTGSRRAQSRSPQQSPCLFSPQCTAPNPDAFPAVNVAPTPPAYLALNFFVGHTDVGHCTGCRSRHSAHRGQATNRGLAPRDFLVQHTCAGHAVARLTPAGIDSGSAAAGGRVLRVCRKRDDPLYALTTPDA